LTGDSIIPGYPKESVDKKEAKEEVRRRRRRRRMPFFKRFKKEIKLMAFGQPF
jgi:hypothetical protein